MSQNKIQALLVSHILKHGFIEILLPDGVNLEIGVTQEGLDGEVIAKDDYCWVIASQGDRSVSIDSYNLGLRFQDDRSKIILDDRFIDGGDSFRRVDVV